jgi:hypothetical protein
MSKAIKKIIQNKVTITFMTQICQIIYQMMEAFVVNHMSSLLLAGDENLFMVTFTATRIFLLSFTLEQGEPFYLLQYYLL